MARYIKRRRLIFVSSFSSFLLALTACAQIMGVDEPVLNATKEAGPQPGNGDAHILDDGGPRTLPDGRCIGAGCACTDDKQCDLAHPKCVAQVCVQCTKAVNGDSCPTGQYCVGPQENAVDAGESTDAADADAKATPETGTSSQDGPTSDPGNIPFNVCAPGCNSDNACAVLSSAAPLCNFQRHQCVACRSKTECPNVNEDCTPSGRCAAKCTDGGPPCSTAGQKCCAPFCVDVTSDIGNCNGCDVKCAGGDTACCNGVCTNVLTSKESCGVCGSACSSSTPTCSAGSCK